MFKYDSIADLVSAAEKENVRISDLVIKEQAEARECSVEEMYNKMHKSFKVMIEAVEKGIVKDSRSVSGLTGGSAWKMREQVAAGTSCRNTQCYERQKNSRKRCCYEYVYSIGNRSCCG